MTAIKRVHRPALHIPAGVSREAMERPLERYLEVLRLVLQVGAEGEEECLNYD